MTRPKRAREPAEDSLYGPQPAKRRKKKWTGKMLNSGKKPNETTTTNASQSRLVSLPPEIRNRIWEFTLCAGTLHFARRSLRPSSRPYRARGLDIWTCNAKEPDDIVAETVRRGTEIAETEAYSDRHAACTPRDAETPCRHEAALLPFKLNTFSFDDYGGYLTRDFIKGLMVIQQKSILRISLGPGFTHGASTWLKKLAALESVTIFQEEVDKPYASIASERMSRHRLEEIVKLFEFAQLSHAVVCIYGRGSARGHVATPASPPLTDPMLYNPLGQEMEAKLLKTEGAGEEETVEGQ